MPVIDPGMGYWSKIIEDIRRENESFQKKIEESAKIKKEEEKPDGEFCAKCKDFFPMAAPNQTDGTMICWRCRQSNA